MAVRVPVTVARAARVGNRNGRGHQGGERRRSVPGRRSRPVAGARAGRARGLRAQGAPCLPPLTAGVRPRKVRLVGVAAAATVPWRPGPRRDCLVALCAWPGAWACPAPLPCLTASTLGAGVGSRALNTGPAGTGGTGAATVRHLDRPGPGGRQRGAAAVDTAGHGRELERADHRLAAASAAALPAGARGVRRRRGGHHDGDGREQVVVGRAQVAVAAAAQLVGGDETERGERAGREQRKHSRRDTGRAAGVAGVRAAPGHRPRSVDGHEVLPHCCHRATAGDEETTISDRTGTGQGHSGDFPHQFVTSAPAETDATGCQ